MNSNTQLNEDYKFKISYVLKFFKDMVSTSEEVENKELGARIEQIKNEQDIKHITDLEKDVETHEVIKKRRTTKNSTKGTKINDVVEEKINSINNEEILDEEKDR